LNGSRAALHAPADGAWDHLAGGEGSGMPRLIVFSQARWSGNDGGRIALEGAPSEKMDALPQGTCEHGFK
jgi:hypothetical protein